MHKQTEKLNCLDLVPYHTPLGGNEFRRENSLMSRKTFLNLTNAADLFISRQGYVSISDLHANEMWSCNVSESGSLRIVIFILFIGDKPQPLVHTHFIRFR